MAVGEPHIVKSYDDQLDKLNDALFRMCGRAERQLADALKAVADRDADLAAEIVRADPEVDALEHYVSEQTVRLLALRSPVADDLRLVVSGLRVAGDLERIADHAANTARRSIVISQQAPVPPLRVLLRLGKAVQDLLHETLDAYINRDAERALAARDRDVEVDEIYSGLFRELLACMAEDPRTITVCTHLMFMAKNIERIGDHATNIAEMTYYLITGRQIETERPKGDSSSAVEG
jgi:phosphate transport system protein